MSEAAIRWFGETWNAPVCDPELEIEVPIGEKCARCDVVFSEDRPAEQQGLAIPFLDPMYRLLVADHEEKLLDLPSNAIEYLYWHRDCFRKAIGL